MSKANIIQRLILGWRFTPRHVLDKQKERTEELKRLYGHLNKPKPNYNAPKKGSRRWLETCSIEELDAYYAEEEKKLELMVERADNSMGEPLKKIE